MRLVAGNLTQLVHFIVSKPQFSACNPEKMRSIKSAFSGTPLEGNFCEMFLSALLAWPLHYGWFVVGAWFELDVGRDLKRRPWLLTAEDWANCPCHHWHIFIHAQLTLFTQLIVWEFRSKEAQMAKHYSKSNVARILPGLECFYTEGDAGPWGPPESLIGFCVRPH